jgi:predicted transcriptional regulator
MTTEFGVSMPYHKSEIHHLPSIAATIKQLLSDFDGATAAYQSYQKNNLKMMCRWLEKFITPRISKAAAIRANELGIGFETLRDTNWFQQKTVLKDPKRDIFHLEHIVPVKKLAKEILDARKEPIEKIVEILLSSEIAWILKCEDDELTKRKFRSTRNNPMECYRICGIELVED